MALTEYTAMKLFLISFTAPLTFFPSRRPIPKIKREIIICISVNIDSTVFRAHGFWNFSTINYLIELFSDINNAINWLNILFYLVLSNCNVGKQNCVYS